MYGKMNENDVLNAFSINSICRVCLKTNNELSPMLDEHVMFYRNIVDEVAHDEYNISICSICHWMLRRFIKFKQQCQSANNLLKEVIYMDLKSLIFLQSLINSHNLSLTKLETHYYIPNTLALATDKCQNDTSTNIVPDFDTNDRCQKLVHDTYKNSGLSDTYHNGGGLVTNDGQSVNDSYNHASDDDIGAGNNDSNDNDIFIDNEDDIPLVLLRNCDQGSGKKGMKKKIKPEVSNHSVNPPIKEDTKQEAGEARSRKSKKQPREGFTSRMVQETEEYVVIKLTKEQVLQEMEVRSKTDAYLRSPYRCEKCVKGFNFKDVLETHLDKHSVKNGCFQCNICEQYCPSAVSLRGHIKSHTTRYKCKLCGHVRLSRQHLLEHHAITHTSAAAAYRCDFCKFTTNKRTVMQRHVRRHAAGEPHACAQCGKQFKSIESLRLHTVRHDKSSRFQCDRCPNKFVYASLLRKHVLCVHERRDYYCVECDVQFKSPESLRLHFKKAKRHRDSSSNKHVCAHCPARFFSPSSLAVHMSTAHNAPKTHACALCRRLYSTRDALRAHSWRVHSQKDARATCPHCGLRFARKSTLKLHIRTHTGARPHACECGAAFAQNKSLQAHMLAKHKNDEMELHFKRKIEM